MEVDTHKLSRSLKVRTLDSTNVVVASRLDLFQSSSVCVRDAGGGFFLEVKLEYLRQCRDQRGSVHCDGSGFSFSTR